MDDLRVGAALRTVRHRRGRRQVDVAASIGVHRSMVSRVERGHLGEHTVDLVREMAAALDVRIDLVPRWRGGDLDRLLNAGHARLHQGLAVFFAALPGWQAAPEVSFSFFGERGIVDILAWHAVRRAVLVVEIKTDVVDISELMGTLDRKRRLARKIARERGWDPVVVGAWVVVAESSTNRRRIEAHQAVLRAAFPLDGRAIRSWLREPSTPMAGLSLWSGAHDPHLSRRAVAIRRVRAPEIKSDERAQPRLESSQDPRVGSETPERAGHARLGLGRSHGADSVRGMRAEGLTPVRARYRADGCARPGSGTA